MMENSLNSQILDLENESKIVSYIIWCQCSETNKLEKIIDYSFEQS
jgi:hypothetical protein